ncbi:MAG: glycosyltransferase family 2 protein [bacterium]|nr:glycosyltransferase family 2 protein [bacterium]
MLVIPSYLTIGTARDVKDPKDRRLFRALEMLPGVLSWGTLVLAVLGSWLVPAATAMFIMAFVLYWFLRTVYFSFHLWLGYRKMRQSEKRDWFSELQNIPGWRELYHLVVIPTYKEPVDVVRECVRSLAESEYPNDRIIVVLGVEGREGEEGEKKGRMIAEEFGDSFFRFQLTVHPDGIAGEIAGKGANEAWATKAVQRDIIDPLSLPYDKVVVSSLDADSVVYEKYFACLSWYYLSSENPTRISFQPVPLFFNNIWSVPPLSRIFSFSATFWHTMNQERPEKLITFSSHAMSFQALAEVGHRQVNVVSDDSRIFWQCFLQYDGEYRVQPIWYPISMDANAAPSFLQTLKNMYLQQRRWAYGAGEIPYFLFGFIKNNKIPFSKKFWLSAELLEGHWSWATSSIIIFALGWLPLVLGGHAFSESLLSYNLPRFTSRVLTFSMVGLISYVVLSINLLPPRHPGYGKFGLLLFILQWITFPFLMIFFTALPALDAQTRLMLGKYMGFWVTPKFRTTLSEDSL